MGFPYIPYMSVLMSECWDIYHVYCFTWINEFQGNTDKLMSPYWYFRTMTRFGSAWGARLTHPPNSCPWSTLVISMFSLGKLGAVPSLRFKFGAGNFGIACTPLVAGRCCFVVILGDLTTGIKTKHSPEDMLKLWVINSVMADRYRYILC